MMEFSFSFQTLVQRKEKQQSKTVRNDLLNRPNFQSSTVLRASFSCPQTTSTMIMKFVKSMMSVFGTVAAEHGNCMAIDKELASSTFLGRKCISFV